MTLRALCLSLAVLLLFAAIHLSCDNGGEVVAGKIPVTITDPTDGAILAGTLTLPATPGPYPAALLIPGSGPHNRDEEFFGHRPFATLADHLMRRGVAVLRMDKRGCGESGGEYIPYDMGSFVGDALAAVEFLKHRPEIDPTRIGLVGHSQGGITAPLAASRSEDVAFVVMLAGPGKWGVDFFCSQAIAMAKASGHDEDDFAKIRALYDRLAPIWTADKISEAERLEGHRIIAELWQYEDMQTRIILNDTDAPGTLRFLRAPHLREFLNYDPALTLRMVSCPVLAVIGDKDVQVPSAENLEAIQNALAMGGNRRYNVVELAGMNHLFQESRIGLPTEYATDEPAMAPALLATITDWLVEIEVIIPGEAP